MTFFCFFSKYVTLKYHIYFPMNIEALVEHIHRRQKRKTGEPYTSHLYAVRDILVEAGVRDKKIIAAALLHDSLEDTDISKEYLQFRFGDKVTKIVDLVSKKAFWNTKFCKMKSKMDEMEQMCQEYPEAVLIKMADRIHNLETLHVFPLAKQRAKMKETNDLLIPLFHKIVKQERWQHLSPIFQILYSKISLTVKIQEHRLSTLS